MRYPTPDKIFPRVIVDVETTSELDLKRVGAYKYATHPSTRVLCLCYTIVRENYQTEIWEWRPGWPVPPNFDLKEGQKYPFCVAHNAAFERLIFKHQLEVYGFTPIPDRQWSCTMLRAAYHGYPMALDMVAEAMNLPFGKDKTGHKIMLQMSRPRTTSPLTWWDETDPAKFKKLVSYCKQDVAVEQILDHYLPELPDPEYQYWMMDLRMNDDGLPLDMDRVHEMVKASDKIITTLDQRMNSVTAGAVSDTRKIQKLKEWAQSQYGFEITTLNKDQIDNVIAAAKLLGPNARPLVDALKWRKTAAKSSIAKLNAMKECEDGGRARGVFQFYGATRTGRYAGRLIQPQNFPRPTMSGEDIEKHFLFAQYDLNILSSALRSCIKPRRRENSLVVVDFSQIEARVLVWLAGQEDVLQAFVNGEDVYTLQANKLGSSDRTLGKVVQLACGYGMGGPKFRETAAKFGVELDNDTARTLVYKWRDANPRIKILWDNIEQLARNSINTPARNRAIHGNGKIETFFVDSALGEILYIILPSGRKLTYLHPQIVGGDITYMGMNQYTRKWERIKTYGGKLVENIVQAVARDLLMDLMVLADEPRWARLIGTVHDEVIVECPTEHAQTHLDTLRNACKCGLMNKWTSGLPLDAEGAVMARYGK